jgi:hypothetical protein
MGAKQSKYDDERHDGSTGHGNNNNCSQHCGFLGNIVSVTKRASMDLIGSPEPETPMPQRRKRAEVSKTMTKEVRSSVYGGLEKEVILEQPESKESDGAASDGAIVHDGPVCIFFFAMLCSWTSSVCYRTHCRAVSHLYKPLGL